MAVEFRSDTAIKFLRKLTRRASDANVKDIAKESNAAKRIDLMRTRRDHGKNVRLEVGDIRVFVSVQDYSVSVMNLERNWTFRMMNNDPTMGRVSGNVDAFVSDLTYMMMAAEFD